MSSDPVSTCFSSNAFSLERTRFFPRQLITADDLIQDQIYFREKSRRHNRLLHGWGIVCGAQVRPGKDNCEVIIEPGYILGPYGDEIYIDREITVNLCQESVDGEVLSPCGANLDPWCSNVQVDRPSGQPLYLAVRYAECQTRPVRVASMACGCNELDCEYSRIQDSYAIKVLTKLPGSYANLSPAPNPDDILKCAGGRDERPCPECPTDPWVILADITLGSDNKVTEATIDRFTHRRYVASFANFYFPCSGRALPTIRTLYPSNASTVEQVFTRDPRLEISFDRKMNADQLRNPDPWLRVWQVYFQEQTVYMLKRGQIAFQGAVEAPVLGENNLTYKYTIDRPDPQFGNNRRLRYVVQIRPMENNTPALTDTGNPPVALDADFQGTNLSANYLDRMWNSGSKLIDVTDGNLNENLWNQLVDTGKTLPSGDGQPGGRFHSWFELSVLG